jgi:hypothetical protein
MGRNIYGCTGSTVLSVGYGCIIAEVRNLIRCTEDSQALSQPSAGVFIHPGERVCSEYRI